MFRMITIRTPRLVLRPWCESDFAPFAALNADPRVMEWFPALQTREESDKMAARCLHCEKEWGLWAVSEIGGADFIGFIGLNEVTFIEHFTPAVEIGWRLAHAYWGKGYATEGARASLQYGFEVLQLPEIVSFTAVQNQRSRAVMERIGMHYDLEGDFNHPRVPAGNKVRRHVLYRLTKEEWKSTTHEAKKNSDSTHIG